MDRAEAMAVLETRRKDVERMLEKVLQEMRANLDLRQDFEREIAAIDVACDALRRSHG